MSRTLYNLIASPIKSSVNIPHCGCNQGTPYLTIGISLIGAALATMRHDSYDSSDWRRLQLRKYGNERVTRHIARLACDDTFDSVGSGEVENPMTTGCMWKDESLSS